MSDRIYQDLRECIDRYAIGFNATESQVELTLLKKLFTEEHAGMYMLLKHELEPVGVIAARADMDVDAASDLLAEMTRKGLIFPIKRDGIQYYAAAPFLHGMFENYSHTNWQSPEFGEVAGLFRQYLENGFFPTGPGMRTIPVNDGVDVSQKKMIAPFENAKKIIEGKTKIGVIPCGCSVQAEALENEPCTQNKEVCLSFDFYAEYVIEGLGQGRWLTRQEALDLIRQAEEDGLVHQIAGDGNTVEAICNCCRDCCVQLRIARLFPVPGEIVLNNFIVSLDAGSCVNCEACVDRCPMGAFSEGEEAISLNPDRCIGCGLCTTTCPAEALVLKSKPEENRIDVFPAGTYTFMRTSADFDADIEKSRVANHG